MDKKNFEAFTNLVPNKKNAVDRCGKEFIDGLVAKGIYAKDDEFWRQVNQYLEVPDHAYNTKQAREKEEKERQIAEAKAREIAEKERLFANKKELYTKYREGWTITVFALPEADKDGNNFVAECTKEPDFKKITPFLKSQNEAYSHACNLLDYFEQEQQKSTIFLQEYKVLKSLYLMIIYLSGWNDPPLENNENIKYKENFTGVSFWNGFDFKILEQLKAENLLTMSGSRKTITVTKEGIKQARDILKKVNLDGVSLLLEQREYHEEYISDENHLEDV